MDDEDDLFAQLEAEVEANPDLHSKRLQDLKDHLDSAKGAQSHAYKTIRPSITTLKTDDEVLRFTTEQPRAILHFFHSDFTRCSIMDQHIAAIVEAQSTHRDSEDGEVSWGRVDVGHAPFVVERMSIRVLPCVIAFRDGVAAGRVVGFEGLLWDRHAREDGTETTRALEERLVEWKVLRQAHVRSKEDMEDEESEDEDTKRSRGIRGRKQVNEEDEDDWD